MIPAALFVAITCLLQDAGDSINFNREGQLVMDGEFDDWADITPALVDPTDAPDGFVDFGEVRINHNDRFVHFLIDFGRTVNAQGLDGTAMLLLDVDGNPQTGRPEHGLPGVDIIIELSPKQEKQPGGAHWGIALKSTTYTPPAADPLASKIPTLNPYDIGLIHAPTHAGRRFEIRIDRGVIFPNTARLFNDDRFSVKLVFTNLHDVLVDQTEAFSYELAPTSPMEAPDQPSDPLSRDGAAEIRFVSWNARVGGILKQPEPFARVLAALQ